MIDDERLNTLREIYTFANVAAYLAAKNGSNPLGYTTFTQDVGDPAVDYNSRFMGFFLQDDIRFTPNFKLLIGVRYDLFDIPDSRPFAANPRSQKFTVDKSNFAPRAGFAWTLDQAGKTVLRGSVMGLGWRSYTAALRALAEIVREGGGEAMMCRSPPNALLALALAATIAALGSAAAQGGGGRAAQPKVRKGSLPGPIPATARLSTPSPRTRWPSSSGWDTSPACGTPSSAPIRTSSTTRRSRPTARLRAGGPSLAYRTASSSWGTAK